MSSNNINILKLEDKSIMSFNEYMNEVMKNQSLIHKYKNIWYYKSEYMNKLHETVYNYALTNKKDDNIEKFINIALEDLRDTRTLSDYIYENSKTDLSIDDFKTRLFQDYGWQ